MGKDDTTERRLMVEQQIQGRGVTDTNVLTAMLKVPRHLFVPDKMRGQAYDDNPISIGMGQTISQPYIVALMTERLTPGPADRVLEIGTGSGYQTAVLAELAGQVFSIERIPELVARARKLLSSLGYQNITMREGDGTLGIPEEAPFDGILVSAGSPEIPASLVGQLKIGGRLVIPVGDSHHQTLYRITRQSSDAVHKEAITGCVFVPLIGAYGWSERSGYFS